MPQSFYIFLKNKSIQQSLEVIAYIILEWPRPSRPLGALKGGGGGQVDLHFQFHCLKSKKKELKLEGDFLAAIYLESVEVYSTKIVKNLPKKISFNVKENYIGPAVS